METMRVSRLSAPLSAVAALAAVVWYLLRHPEGLALGEAAVNLGWLAKKFGPAPLMEAAGRHAAAHVAAAVVLITAWGAGARATRWLGGRRRPGVAEAAALGLGVVALSVFAAGVTGLLQPAVLAGMALLATAAAPWRLRRGRAPRRGRLSWWFLGAAALLALDWTACLSPEWFYDGRVYHLGLPDRFLLTRKFPVLPEHLLTFLPLNAEMLYAAALAFGGEEAAKLLNVGYAVLLVAAVAGLARGIAGREGSAGWAGGLAAAVFVSFPVTQVENEITFGDNLRVVWEVLALAAAIRGLGGGRGAWCRAGAFAGFAMGSKYLAVIGAALIIPIALSRRRGRAGPALAYAAVAAAMVSPWLARNWLAGGDPVYPFGRGVFPTLRFGADDLARWMRDNRHYGVADQTIGSWLTLPYRMVMDLNDGAFGTFTTGPLPLALAFPLVLRRRWPAAALAALVVAAGGALAWSLTSHLIRYLLPALAVLAALLGWGAAGLTAASPRYARVLLAAVGVWVAASGVMRLHHRSNLETTYGIYSRAAGGRDPAGLAGERGFGSRFQGLPPGPVLLVGEDRVLGCGRRWKATSIFDVPLPAEWARAGFAPERMAVKARQAGVRIVLVNGDGLNELKARGLLELTVREWAVLNGWWKSLGVAYRDPPWTAYVIPARRRVE